MSESYVEVQEGEGKKLRTIEKTVGVNVVHEEVVVVNNGSISPITSVVDDGNSTTVPLVAGGTFTGTGVDLLGYSNLTTQLHADVDSASDGMQFQFSIDNINWDEVYSFNMDVSEENIRRFQFPVQSRYYRVNYINGASSQSVFRVQTLLHKTGILTSIHRAGNPVTDDRSAQLVKSIITGKKPSGDFVNVQTTTAGNLKVAVEEFDTSLPDGSNTIGVTQRDWTLTETIPISATNLDIRTITETIPVSGDFEVSTINLLKDGSITVLNTVPVWEQGKITYSTIPINSITFDYVGGTLSTLNFYNLDSTIEFSLILGYTGGTLSSLVRS